MVCSIRSNLIDGMSPVCFYARKAGRIENAFLQAACGFWSAHEIRLMLAADADIEQQFVSMKSSCLSGDQKGRCLTAVAMGCETSDEVSDAVEIEPKNASAWLSVLCREGKILKFQEGNLGRAARTAARYCLA